VRVFVSLATNLMKGRKHPEINLTRKCKFVKKKKRKKEKEKEKKQKHYELSYEVFHCTFIAAAEKKETKKE
jgi:hypothetical protein